MKYLIILSGILSSSLYAGAPVESLAKALAQQHEPKYSIRTFYEAVEANDIESISEHLKTEKFYPLNNLAKKALKKRHAASLSMLLQAGARPPLYEAAEQGRKDLVLLSLKHLQNLKEPLDTKEKDRILKRLIKTDNAKIFHMYFDYKALLPEDISHALVANAKRESNIYTALIEKKCMYGTGECAICITTFTNEEAFNTEFLLKCGHMFHKECSDKWFEKNPTCPLCKKKVRSKKK